MSRHTEPAIPLAAFIRIEKPTLDDYDDPVRRAVLIEQTKLEARERAMVEVRELLAAGWKYELPDISDSEPWQWYWRAPPKRAGSRGRFYWSTTQAVNALRRTK